MTTTCVVVAEDQAPMRALLREELERAGLQVCAEARDAEGAVRTVAAQQPDVALIDVQILGDGVEALREIRAAAKATAVVVLAEPEDIERLMKALSTGAAGYVHDGTDLRTLPAALLGVLAGAAILPIAPLQPLIEESSRQQRKEVTVPGRPRIRLTEREWEVLELLADDFSTAEIGRQLFIAQVTVRTHIAAILHKLRVEDRESAAALMRSNRGRAEERVIDEALRRLHRIGGSDNSSTPGSRGRRAEEAGLSALPVGERDRTG